MRGYDLQFPASVIQEDSSSTQAGRITRNFPTFVATLLDLLSCVYVVARPGGSLSVAGFSMASGIKRSRLLRFKCSGRNSSSIYQPLRSVIRQFCLLSVGMAVASAASAACFDYYAYSVTPPHNLEPHDRPREACDAWCKGFIAVDGATSCTKYRFYQR
jgi:hypothetical protein